MISGRRPGFPDGAPRCVSGYSGSGFCSAGCSAPDSAGCSGSDSCSDYSFEREDNLLLVSTPVQKIFNDVGITDFSKKTQSSFLVFSKGQKAPFLAKWCLLKIIVLL